MLVLCLSVFVSVCLWVCGGAGAGGGGCLLALCLSAFVSVCLLLCGGARNPSKSWGVFATSLGEMLGQSLGYLGRVPSQTWGVLRELFGESWAKIARKALGILRES